MYSRSAWSRASACIMFCFLDLPLFSPQSLFGNSCLFLVFSLVLVLYCFLAESTPVIRPLLFSNSCFCLILAPQPSHLSRGPRKGLHQDKGTRSQPEPTSQRLGTTMDSGTLAPPSGPRKKTQIKSAFNFGDTLHSLEPQPGAPHRPSSSRFHRS